MRILDIIARVLRGDAAACAAMAAVAPEEVRAEALTHGVLPLLVESLPPALPRDFADRLRRDLHAGAAADMARELELRRVVQAMAEASVSAVLMKGAVLAYRHYARPDLRPRIDSDVLVSPDRRGTAHAVLVNAGYEAAGQASGDLVTQQTTYVRTVDETVTHVIDLHWRIANPHAFARALTFDELWADAVPLPALGPAARGLSDVHALLVACLHRVAHHGETERLIWLFDIHLLASTLSATDWTRVAALAEARGLSAVCRDGLRQAAAWCGTRLPDLPWLAGEGSSAQRDPGAAFLGRRRPQLQVLVSDLRMLSWGERARLIGQHLFPSADYMKTVYAPGHSLPLPWLYLRRAWYGARKWLARG